MHKTQLREEAHPPPALSDRLMESAHFGYTQEELRTDWGEIVQVVEATGEDVPPELGTVVQEETQQANVSMTEEIKKAKELCDLGVITEEEFKELKAKLIAKL